MKYDIEFKVEPQRITICSVTDQPATLVDWLLMLEALDVQLKVKFANQVGEIWEKKKGFSDSERMMLLRELDKLEGDHPNVAEHDRLLREAVIIIAEKLELKHDMEHLN